MRIPKKLSRSLRDWIRYIGSDVTPRQIVGRIKARDETINKLDEVIERFAMSEEGQTMITREERYALDREEQNRFIAKNARKEGLKKGRAKGKAEGKAEAIENYLSVRFPDDFAERFQLWRPKLYKKSLPVLNSLLTTSVSCSSLDEFTQNL